MNEAESFEAKISERHRVNDYTDTFIFKANRVIPGVKNYYRDLSMLGRHYKIESSDLKGKPRYYTICNCLIPSIYQEYLRVIYEAVKNDSVAHFDSSLFEDKDSNEVALTIKNYRRIGGLSEFMSNPLNGYR